MHIGVNLGPTGDWSAMLAAAQEADVSGFDSVLSISRAFGTQSRV
jgi:hypothetical protein